jgi:hypothetical protein
VDTSSDGELRSALQRVLDRYFGQHRANACVNRRPSPYGSSFALEELEVVLDDGTRLPLMFKDLSRRSLLADARAVKPGFLHDPRREIETYRTILAPAGLGTATCYGAVCDVSADRHWLFVEKVAGVELYQVGDFNVWLEAARWLARLHGRYMGKTAALAEQVPLVRHSGSFYRRWLRRARSFLHDTPLPAPQRRQWDRLASGYDRVIAATCGMPATFIHGDFFPANVLVQETPAGLRICPVDWEMAAAGPGLMDLAALSSGKWSEDERRAMALAYHEACEVTRAVPADRQAFLTDLDRCRLHLAVQCLGWAEGWSPPAAQAHDWPGEALLVAERLEVPRQGAWRGALPGCP